MYTHMDIHPPPCPPLSFLRVSSFVGFSFRFFRCFLRLVSLPQSRAKYSPFASHVRRKRPRVCVCVCVKPCFYGFFLLVTISRGPAADKQTLANKAMLVRWMRSLINCVYLRQTFGQAVPIFDSMVVHDTSHKPFSFRRFQLLRVRELQTSEQFVKHFSCADLFTLRFFTFLLDLGTGLTENQCQRVCGCALKIFLRKHAA